MALIITNKLIYLTLTLLFSFLGCTNQIHDVIQKEVTVQKLKEIKSKKKLQSYPKCHLKENKPRPSWIDLPPQNDEYIFGIGVAPKQLPVSNQIRAAKYLAMQDISQQINVYVNSIYQENIKQTDSFDNTNIQSQIQLTTREWLKNVRTIDQWNDLAQCNVYILLSVKKQ